MQQPEKIGKYAVLGVAGRGAMGTVYKGHDPFIDRPVAIKVCTLLEDDESTALLARRMFFNEAQAAGALDHPNILHIYDAGENEGEPYIVMEYVEGGATLKDHCTPQARLPMERCVRIMHQCAKALEYAHRRGVTHRDIKPANIMLTPEGEAKIGDFGIAQRTQAERTQLMGAYGSPAYMSPEQAQEDELNQQTDLYSLGVSFYEALASRPPFDARQLAALVLAITTDDAPALSSFNPDVPEALEAIIARCMEKDRAQRYQTGGEIAANLAALFDHLTRPPDEMSDEDKLAAARSLEFFNEFSDEEVEEVVDVAVWERFAAGERLIAEGAIEKVFYLLVSGDVDISVGDTVVGTLGKGACVGEMGYLTDVKRTASVTAASDVMAMKIDSALMEWATIPVQLQFNKAFLETLISRLHRTTVDLAARM